MKHLIVICFLLVGCSTESQVIDAAAPFVANGTCELTEKGISRGVLKINGGFHGETPDCELLKKWASEFLAETTSDNYVCKVTPADEYTKQHCAL